jgi:hypothetical protein
MPWRASPATAANRACSSKYGRLGLLDFDTRAYGRIPDGQQLRALREQHLLAKPVADAAPGDVLLMRFTRHPQHLAIVGDRGDPFSLIHVYADASACVEYGADVRWLRRIVAVYGFDRRVLALRTSTPTVCSVIKRATIAG